MPSGLARQSVSCRYGKQDPNNLDLGNLPLTIRAVFIIGPYKKLKLSMNYPASVGRNMDEIVRCVDALQLSAKHSVVSALAMLSRCSRHTAVTWNTACHTLIQSE